MQDAATVMPATPEWALLREFTRLLLLAVALPVLLLAGMILWQSGVGMREQSTARLATVAEAKARELDTFLDVHVAVMRMLAERRSVSGTVADTDAWAGDLQRVARHFRTFVSLQVVDARGTVAATVPALPAGAGPQSVTDRSYFTAPARTGRAHVSGGFRGRAIGTDPLVAVSVPLRDGGRFAGVVQGSIRAQTFGASLSDLDGRGIEWLLLDAAGTVLHASDRLAHEPLDRAADAPFEDLLQGREPFTGQRGAPLLPGVLRDGGDAYATAVRLEQGWHLILLLPREQLDRQLRRNVVLTLGLLALVLGGVVTVVGARMRGLGNSVRKLLDRMQQFALDRASAPIAPDNLPRELAPLAEAMNRLAQRARASYEQVSLSLEDQSRLRSELQAVAQRLLTVQEDERQSLSRELHDDIGQSITSIKLGATALADDALGADPAARREILDEIVEIADQTVVKLRNIALLLRPPQLDSLGLEAALRGQIAVLSRNARTRITLDMAPLAERPPPDVELACFRIAQEAITNAMRHAGAASIGVTIRVEDGILHLVIVDDGPGFDPAAANGLGLLTMRERAQQIGGSLDINAAPGAGTTVSARLPMRQAAGIVP